MTARMAHTADDNRKLPKYVTINYMKRDRAEEIIISLDDRLKRMIVEKTWDGDLTQPRLILSHRLPVAFESKTEQEYCYLAYVGAKPSDVPCDECREPWHPGCYFNAIWPPTGSCMSCIRAGESSKCSLSVEIRPNASSGPPLVNAQLLPAARLSDPLTWWINDGLRIFEREGQTESGRKRLQLASEALSKLCELQLLNDEDNQN
ncbi:hypothetical protein AAP_03299 [Ascosphaera apis ARSEF 7405]|uniref:Uncharacterized protein n=1 Tax=Ascosphaera apis ARSEF 7405 TaxID=392613 RepID=A0A162ICS1_9EURO|nr:hypothetical protein AAP_03299 [Ascosphaera apis ARSEF 7405]